MTLFEMQRLTRYLKSEQGKKTIEVYVTSLKRQLYKINQQETKDIGQLCELIDKIIITVKLSKSLEYRPIPKSICEFFISEYKMLLHDKSVKMAMYIFTDKPDLSEAVQQSLFYTLTGQADTIAKANEKWQFLNQTIKVELII